MADLSSTSPVTKRRRLQQQSAPPALIKNSIKCSFTGDTLETIGEKELWLITVPMELNVETLNGLVIDLKSSKDLEVKDGSSDITVPAAQYTSIPRSCKENTCLPFLSAGDKPGRLTIGHPFNGELSIQRSLCIPEIQLSPQPKKSMDIPTDLKQRWRPFGSSKPEQVDAVSKEFDASPRKKKKKSKSKSKHA